MRAFSFSSVKHTCRDISIGHRDRFQTSHMVYDVKSLLTLQWAAELEGLSNYRLKRSRVLTFITAFEKGLKKCEKIKS